jgi:hypothetical protein
MEISTGIDSALRLINTVLVTVLITVRVDHRDGFRTFVCNVNFPNRRVGTRNGHRERSRSRSEGRTGNGRQRPGHPVDGITPDISQPVRVRKTRQLFGCMEPGSLFRRAAYRRNTTGWNPFRLPAQLKGCQLSIFR